MHKVISCSIQAITPLMNSVYQIFLSPEIGLISHDATPLYYPGQYLELLIGDKKYAYSIANYYEYGRLIELHIRVSSKSVSAVKVLNYLESEGMVDANLGLGDCYIKYLPCHPVVFIVGGTGFSQAKSMIEYLFKYNFAHAIYLYWQVYKRADLYLHGLAEAWQLDNPHFCYRPMVSSQSDLGDGSIVTSCKAIIQDVPDISNVSVFASGSPDMVYAYFDTLIDNGANSANFYSDVFAYAPRASA